jgi:chromosome segregation ATPase
MSDLRINVEVDLITKLTRELDDARAEVERLQGLLNEQKLLTASYATDVGRLEAEVKRLRGQLDACNASAAETERQLAALVEAGDRLAADDDYGIALLEAWAEAKRKAGL